jgi:hypothetical protein
MMCPICRGEVETSWGEVNNHHGREWQNLKIDCSKCFLSASLMVETSAMIINHHLEDDIIKSIFLSRKR